METGCLNIGIQNSMMRKADCFLKNRDNCLIIAEAGVNHNGRLDIALELCDAAKASGADVVKFQTWITEALITRNVKCADYQRENTGSDNDQFEMLKELELSLDDFRVIKKHCDDIGIVFASTADEKDSLDYLIDLGIPFVKVGSGDIGNIPYLRYIGNKGLPVVLSTGMSTIDDVRISLNAIKEGGDVDVILLHCTTNYPCPYEQANVKAMVTLKNEFRVPVGFSDHTMGKEASLLAVSLDACVIEKHFTLSRNMKGPDHIASMEPDEFADMVKSIRILEKCMGNGKKVPTKAEEEISKVVTKRIVAYKPIKKNEVFSDENICIKRCDEGLKAAKWDSVIGTRATKDYNKDEGIKPR